MTPGETLTVTVAGAGQLAPIVKEQQTQIEALKQQNAALKVDVTATTEAVEVRLRRLEAGSGQAQR